LPVFLYVTNKEHDYYTDYNRLNVLYVFYVTYVFHVVLKSSYSLTYLYVYV